MGFEPTVGANLQTVFETATIDHSVTSPRFRGRLCGGVDIRATQDAQGGCALFPARFIGTGSQAVAARCSWQGAGKGYL